MKVLFLSILFFIPTLTFAEMPAFPMAFWGTVTVDGVAAPTGSVIRVYDDLTKVGEIIIEESGVYGYTEPTKQKLILGSGDGKLTFKIQSPSINGGVETGGVSPVTHTGFVSGETVQKDLTFVVSQAPSGGGSSGGGGGGGKKKVVEPTKLVLGVSTTTPNSTLPEEEQKIALQMQLIELLTQLVVLLKLKMSLISL